MAEQSWCSAARQRDQVEEGVGRREGHAVIAADVGGQTTLFKKPLKHDQSVVFFEGRERLADTAGMIGDRQRVAVWVISGPGHLDSLGARDDPSWPFGSRWDCNGLTSDATGKASSGRYLTSLRLVVEPQSTS